VLRYQETPIIKIEGRISEQAGLSLFIKREDQNHPLVSGNKWWKLKYNLEEVVRLGSDTLLTFGGAYSNHLYATAAAAHELGLKSIGIVRGEEILPLNPTLEFAQSMGMRLHFVSREVYRDKSNPSFIDSLYRQFGDFYMLPEGGTNALAIRGVEEFGKQLMQEDDFDYVCLPVGTGGTMAGLINAISGPRFIGFSSLKGGGFLKDEVSKWLTSGHNNWQIETNFHFGGYGKTTDSLINFIGQFESDNGIPLDPVYTGKMMFGIFEMIKAKVFPAGSKILALHTGGLQARVRMA